jgi:acyl dehydratase
MTSWSQGYELEPQEYAIRRVDLILYAGAAGDFNPIHWSDRIAASVGLPGVIAHGMYTMALAGRAVTRWVGSTEAIREFAVRFTKPVVVPDSEEGTVLRVSGVVSEIRDDGTARIDITATNAGQKVMGAARAFVHPPT